MSKYRKSIAAFLGAITTWGITASIDGYQQAEWWGLAAALVAVIAVWGVENEPAHKPIVFDDSGHSDPVTVLAAVILAGILVVVILVVTGKL